MKNFNYKNVFSIAKKELLSYVSTPSYYIVLVLFVVLWFFFFFKNAFLVGDATLRSLFDMMPWFTLVLVPALTMGLISKEKDEGTLEFLLTHPLRNAELVLGKFIGVCVYILPSLLLTVVTAFSFSLYSDFDWGAYVVQLFGAVLFMFSLAAMGLFISALFSNQIASLLVTAAASFMFILMGSEFLTNSLPLSLTRFAGNLSMSQHLNSMSRGVIESRDLVYFISFILTFLTLTYINLSLRKTTKRVMPYFSNGLLFIVIVTIFTGINSFGDILPGRLDLTSAKTYTLSESTKEVLSLLENNLEINYYVSRELPVQYTPLSKEISDLLKDYQFYSRGKVVVNIKDPSSKPELVPEAQSAGVTEVQFNVVGQEEFQVKKGYLGLAFSYGDRKEVIPAVTDTSDLEYQLTSLILKLSIKDKNNIVFLSGHDEKSPFSDYSVLIDDLVKTSNVDTIAYNEKSKSLEIPENTNLLIIAGPKKEITETESKEISSFMAKGGNVLFLIDMFNIDTSIGFAEENTNSFAQFLKELGVSVNKDALYDVQFNETIRFGGGGANYLLPYPFWARTGITEEAFNLGFGKINFVSLPWTATLSLDTQKLNNAGYTSKVLLVSSNTAGVKNDSFTISPEKSNFGIDNLKSRELVYLLEPQQMSKDTSVGIIPGKIAVVGDSDFLTDQFVTNNVGNFSFGLGLVSNLAGSNSLSDIKSKSSGASKLQFENQTQPDFVRFSNMTVFVLVPVLVGLGFYFRRRYLYGRSFEGL